MQYKAPAAACNKVGCARTEAGLVQQQGTSAGQECHQVGGAGNDWLSVEQVERLLQEALLACSRSKYSSFSGSVLLLQERSSLALEGPTHQQASHDVRTLRETSASN